MKKLFLPVIILCITQAVNAADPNPFAEGVKVYRFTSSDTISIAGNSSIRTYRDAKEYLEMIFDVTIDIREIELSDNDSNAIIILDVDIITDKSYSEIFSGWSSHRSTLIEELWFNLLQPYLSRQEWNISALTVKLNGIFTDSFDSDITYPSLVTQNTLLDWLEHLHPGNGGE
jgi:hypothetical protein